MLSSRPFRTTSESSTTHTKDNLDDEDYLDWLDDVFVSVKEVLKDNGSFFLSVGSTAKKPWLAMRVMEVAIAHFELQNEIIWAKSLTISGRSIGQFNPVRSKSHLATCHEHSKKIPPPDFS
ncbi:DNA methyltransferase [Thalassoglobus neptunius]|uniref:DNA methyltransferase n=1 Tax=Thalassoglobus neptunius TaxID=1938619 RepID=UPI0011B6903B